VRAVPEPQELDGVTVIVPELAPTVTTIELVVPPLVFPSLLVFPPPPWALLWGSRLPRSLATGKTVKMKSDLNVKLDFSIRDNKTILRRIEENNNQISTGTRQVSINASADYMISSKVNIRLFYDQTISKPHVSAQIPTSNTNAGLSLRFTLAQ
jgi:hypothetical protein